MIPVFLQQVDVACRAFHQEPLDDGVDADDSSTEGDDGVSPKEVIAHVVPIIRFLDPIQTKATVVLNFPRMECISLNQF